LVPKSKLKRAKYLVIGTQKELDSSSFSRRTLNDKDVKETYNYGRKKSGDVGIPPRAGMDSPPFAKGGLRRIF
jgi:hypothetical protein